MRKILMSDLMFTRPDCGWTTFNIYKYCPNIPKEYASMFHASYLQSGATMLFEMFLDMLNPKIHHLGLVPFDAEGWYWYLVETEYGFNLLLDNPDVEQSDDVAMPLLNTFLGFEMLGSSLQLAQDWVDCYETFPEEWLAFDLCELSSSSLNEENIREHLKEMLKTTFNEEIVQEKVNNINKKRDELNLLCLQLKNLIKENSKN